MFHVKQKRLDFLIIENQVFFYVYKLTKNKTVSSINTDYQRTPLTYLCFGSSNIVEQSKIK